LDKIFYFYLALCIRSFAPTNPNGAQAFGKEFPANAPRLIQEVNLQSDGSKMQLSWLFYYEKPLKTRHIS
jgi:hypothetical protein